MKRIAALVLIAISAAGCDRAFEPTAVVGIYSQRPGEFGGLRTGFDRVDDTLAFRLIASRVVLEADGRARTEYAVEVRRGVDEVTTEVRYHSVDWDYQVDGSRLTLSQVDDADLSLMEPMHFAIRADRIIRVKPEGFENVWTREPDGLE